MNMDNLESSLKQTLVNSLFLDVAPEQIADDHDLSEYGVDSFLLLELLSAIELEYNVHLEPSDITAQSLKTVAGLASLIRGKQA